MKIEPFVLERWMTAHELSASYDIAESGIVPLSTNDLLAFEGPEERRSVLALVVLVLQPHFIPRRSVFARNDSGELGPAFVFASATSTVERHAPRRSASGS